MLDIGWTELIVIAVIALIVIGPRELPAMLRTIGNGMSKIRRMASDFQGQFNDALREAELDDLRKQAEKLSNEMTGGGSFSDPLGKVTSDLQKAIESPAKAAPAKTKPPADTAGATETAAEPKPSEAVPAAADASEPAAGEGGRGA
jgi:sec-independent protein translocase protein TatB